MPRGLTISSALLSGNSVKMAYAIKIGFNTPIYLTDNSFDLSIDGNTYTSSSFLLGVTSPTETNKMRNSSTTIRLSSVNQTYLSVLLNEDWMNSDVLVQRVVLDSSNAIDGDPIILFKGLLTGYEFQEKKNKSEITLLCASHWSDFERIAGRRTNHSSQTYWFTDDNGMKYASATSRNVKWGSK